MRFAGVLRGMTSASKTKLSFGSWPSPVTPGIFSGGFSKAICDVAMNESGVFWTEQSIASGRRELCFKLFASKGAPHQRLAEGLRVETSVHEYGGGAICLRPDGAVVFVANEAILLQKPGSDVQKVYAEDKLRFADVFATEKYVYAVCEDHRSNDHYPSNFLVRVAFDNAQLETIASGADFYAYPRVNANRNTLAWMQWNNPNMPWDNTEIWTAELGVDETLVPSSAQKLLRKDDTNFYCPSWSPTNELHFVSDETGFWNVWKANGDHGHFENVFPLSTDIGYPLWQFGDSPFATNGIVTFLAAKNKCVVKIKSSVYELDLPDYCEFSHLRINAQNQVCCIARGPKDAATLISLNLNELSAGKTPIPEVIRETRQKSDFESLPISTATEVTFRSGEDTIQAFYYPPYSNEYEGLEDEKPPLVLMGHSGPTAHTTASLDLKKQFYTSRGFAVLDVNYRGSTNFGRDFRKKLYGQWGIVDRDDMIAAAKFAAANNLADPQKIAIIGSSAGGYLVLSCLMKEPSLFRAAASSYGIGDLEAMCADTHKFELAYNNVLLGPGYAERSPSKHLHKLRTPTVFFHGTKDTVVPCSQSVGMFEALKAAGVPTALELFEGEGHGFRNPENVRRTVEGIYYFITTVMGITPATNEKLNIDNYENISANKL